LVPLVIPCLGLTASMPGRTSGAGDPLDRINHIIVIFQENWSFDGLFGKFPGANGIANAGPAAKQVDRNGRPYATLPPSIDTRLPTPGPDPRIATDLPMEPFNLAQFVSPTDFTGDLVHAFYQEQHQVNGGKMDQFIAWSNAGGLVMSYYDATNWPVGRLAQQYVLADNFFHAAFGGSFLNHQWLICACTPVYQDAPQEIRAQLDANGFLARDGQVTPDGYVVNTSYSIHAPRNPRVTDPRQFVPSQTAPTIGDRLTERHVNWAWYAGGWNDALAGRAHPLYQYQSSALCLLCELCGGHGGQAAPQR
jgi:phospholipase C